MEQHKVKETSPFGQRKTIVSNHVAMKSQILRTYITDSTFEIQIWNYDI